MGAFLGGLLVLAMIVALGIALAPYILPILAVLGFIVVALVLVAVVLRGVDIIISYPLGYLVHWWKLLTERWIELTHPKVK